MIASVRKLKTNACVRATLTSCVLLVLADAGAGQTIQAKPNVTVGVYYFDGLSGRNKKLAEDPQFAKLNPPTHLTKRLLGEFAGREPIWGWRDDKLEIVEQQIYLATEHGVAFFAFCWCFHEDPNEIAKDPLNTG